MNDILQWAAVVTILIIIVIYIVRKMSHKDNGGCSGCALNGNCKSRECNDGTETGQNKQKE